MSWLIALVLMASGVCFQSMGDPLLDSNDSDLMRRSRHSITRKRRDGRQFLHPVRSDDRHLQRADGEAPNFKLRWLSGRGICNSERESR